MYEDIKQQFREVIIHSQGIENPQVDLLFDQWAKAKEKFIHRFGGLIYEWPEPIEFSLDENEKRSRAMEFSNCVYDSFNNPVLAEFIDENLDSFFENKVTKTVPNSIIPEGMKLVKAFKFFESNKTTLRNIQDMASQLIQENKVKGTLCFSVHPLDFLSSSENTYNWRSCHALDGEYRAGNLSYMVDEVTFMVYLKGADNTVIPMFPPKVKWNSKKWRMLIHAHIDDEIIFAGRQYPFSSKSGIDTVLNIYNNIFQHEDHNDWGWVKYDRYGGWRADYVNGYVPFDAPINFDPIELSTKYLVVKGKLIDIEELVVEGPNSLNYNDILRSTSYHFPYYAILNPTGGYWRPKKFHPIVVGEEVTCLHCGGEIITNAETMRCDNCEIKYGYEENDTYGSCACCGARIYLDEAISVGDYDELICEGCYDSQCFVCDSCGEVFYKNDRVFLPVGHNGEEEVWYCNHCYQDYLDSKKENLTYG